MSEESRSTKRRLRASSVGRGGWSSCVRCSEEEWERKWSSKSMFERGYNSLIRTAHCSLQKGSYAPHDPRSTSQHIVAESKVILDHSLKPSHLVVTLNCKRADSSIVSSKLVWEEVNERVCVVDALGPRGREPMQQLSARIFRMRRCT